MIALTLSRRLLLLLLPWLLLLLLEAEEAATVQEEGDTGAAGVEIGFPVSQEAPNKLVKTSVPA